MPPHPTHVPGMDSPQCPARFAALLPPAPGGSFSKSTAPPGLSIPSPLHDLAQDLASACSARMSQFWVLPSCLLPLSGPPLACKMSGLRPCRISLPWGCGGCQFYRVPTTQSKISVADLEVPGSEPFRARLWHHLGPAPHRGTPKCPGLPMTCPSVDRAWGSICVCWGVHARPQLPPASLRPAACLELGSPSSTQSTLCTLGVLCAQA